MHMVIRFLQLLVPALDRLAPASGTVLLTPSLFGFFLRPKARHPSPIFTSCSRLEHEGSWPAQNFRLSGMTVHNFLSTAHS
jgi:hypothetical protein